MQRHLIGMIRERGKPGEVATALALVAKARGADLIFFHPEDVDLQRSRIAALAFDGQAWQRADSRFPDVIENDDHCSLPKYREIWHALTAGAPYTTRRLGGKLEMTARFRKDPVLSELLIPEQEASTDAALLDWIDRHGVLALKPVFGSQGQGIRRVRRQPQGISVFGSEEDQEMFLREGEPLLPQICGTRPYLMQKFIDAALPGGSPFDIRLHVRRDSRARWQVVRIYARIGRPGTIISNLSAGGSIGDALPILRSRYGAGAEAVHSRLQHLAEDLPRRIQRLYPGFMIDALGLDMGLDAEGRPWLFEANSFPGAKYFETRDARPRIGYCLWLAERHRRREELTKTQ